MVEFSVCCPKCDGVQLTYKGNDTLDDGSLIDVYQCLECGRKFTVNTNLME